MYCAENWRTRGKGGGICVRPRVLGDRYTISLGRFADGDLITKRELGKCLGCSDRTLQRMVERFEIPPPMTLGGRKIWIIGKVRAWLTDAAERREAEALKEARRLRVFET